MSLTNLNKSYNQGIKLQITTKNIKKDYRLCMKSQAPEKMCAKGVFQIQPPISGVNFSNNISIAHIT